MKSKSHNIVNITKQHFAKYTSCEMDSEDVIKIVENFSGFAKLILKLEQKRQQNKETTA